MIKQCYVFRYTKPILIYTIYNDVSLNLSLFASLGGEIYLFFKAHAIPKLARILRTKSHTIYCKIQA